MLGEIMMLVKVVESDQWNDDLIKSDINKCVIYVMTKGGFRQLTGKVKKLHTGNSSQKKKTEVIFSCIEKK